ncbi:hypothetical protein GFD30_21790 [Glycomyces sp. NEAU-7082]|uniref:Uncharacterized protein n=1 Tax=Glycomyces albidus TaxID=2656774 RepID=A0A6L5GFI6_9ACTN|nr:hypothetical protein [Glycomyces albidus]
MLLALLTACGAGGGGSEDDASATPTTSPSESPTGATTEETSVPENSPSLPPLDESSKPGSTSELTITGTVQSGVESGCLILEHEGTVYGIYGSYDSSIVYAGAEVTLHGVIDEGMMTTCQQGTPFVVSEAETAG